MNRNDFQKLAILRLREAEVLLNNKCYEGAYYLSGYAIECALKACIAKTTKEYDFPRKDVRDIYTHSLSTLIKVAGLITNLDEEMKNDSVFASNWGTVKDWTEESRYNNGIDENEAISLYQAINDINNGILKWLKKYW